MWDDTTSYLYFLPEHIIPNIINGLLSPLLWKYREQSTLQRHLHINDHSSPVFSIGNTLKMKHLALVITISICQLCYGSSAPINFLTPPPWPVVRPPWRPGFIPRSFRVSQFELIISILYLKPIYLKEWSWRNRSCGIIDENYPFQWSLPDVIYSFNIYIIDI